MHTAGTSTTHQPIIKMCCKNVQANETSRKTTLAVTTSFLPLGATQLKPTGDIHLPPGCHTLLLIFQAFLVLQHLPLIKNLPIFVVVVVALQSSGLQM